MFSLINNTIKIDLKFNDGYYYHTILILCFVHEGKKKYLGFESGRVLDIKLETVKWGTWELMKYMQVYLGYGNASDNTSHQLLSFKYVGNVGEVCQWAIHDLICPMGCIVFPEILLQVLLLKNCMMVG